MTKAEPSDRSRDVIKLEATQPLRISLVDAKGKIIPPYPPKRRKKRQKLGQRIGKTLKLLRSDRKSLIRSGVALFVIGLFIVLGAISSYTFVSPLWSAGSGLSYIVRYSPWIVIGDEQEIEITLANGNTFTLTNVRVCTVFDEALPVSTCTDGSNIIDFGDLAPDERMTKSCRMSVRRRTASGTEGRVSVLAEEIAPVELVLLPFAVFPIPYFRTSGGKIVSLLMTASGSAIGWLVKRAAEDVWPEE